MLHEMIKPVLTAVISLGIMGLLFGILLAFAGKIFTVKTDERIPKITKVLPGANCGACGYAGCVAYADAIVNNGAKVNMCSVGASQTANKVAEIMGVNAGDIKHMRAQVMCSGTKDLAKSKFIYKGINDCITASKIGGGLKECPFGCLGLGTCVKVCPFGAIKIENGVAVVEYEKCAGCGVCVKACPKSVIELVPFEKNYWVGCISKDKGPVTKSYCDVGCIGCGICAKNCPTGAITVGNSIAVIDYEKCTECGICAEKCPRKIIWGGKKQIKDGDTLNTADIIKPEKNDFDLEL